MTATLDPRPGQSEPWPRQTYTWEFKFERISDSPSFSSSGQRGPYTTGWVAVQGFNYEDARSKALAISRKNRWLVDDKIAGVR